MSAKGYTATADNPDVKVDYFITQKTGISASQSSVSFGLGRYGSRGGVGMGYTVPVGEAQTYEEGTLTINIVNTKDNALLWTGSSSQILGENQTPETIDQNINNIARLYSLSGMATNDFFDRHPFTTWLFRPSQCLGET